MNKQYDILTKIKEAKSVFFSFLLCLFIILSCSACGSSSQSTTSQISFTDSNGQHISLSQKPVKVAVLFSSLADMWIHAGGKVNITVGDSIQRGLVAKQTTLVDQYAGETINTEKLIGAKPDFVICSSELPGQIKAAKAIRAAGIPCASFQVSSFSDYLKVFKTMTEITGNKTAFKQYGTAVKKKVDKILSQVPSAKTSLKILFIRTGSSQATCKAKSTKRHFAAMMLHELGATNIADKSPVIQVNLSIEKIIEEDPDSIFITTMGHSQDAKKYMQHLLKTDLWKSLKAVKNKKVYYLPKALFQYKPNAQWAVAYAYLAHIMYPDVTFHE